MSPYFYKWNRHSFEVVSGLEMQKESLMPSLTLSHHPPPGLCLQVTLLIRQWLVPVSLFPAELCGAWKQLWDCAQRKKCYQESTCCTVLSSQGVHAEAEGFTSEPTQLEAGRQMEELDLPLPTAENYNAGQTTSRNHTWIPILRSHLVTNFQSCLGKQGKPGL